VVKRRKVVLFQYHCTKRIGARSGNRTTSLVSQQI